jgi:hypothetical protein
LQYNIEFILEILKLLVQVICLLYVDLKLLYKVVVHLAVLLKSFLQDFVIIAKLRVKLMTGSNLLIFKSERTLIFTTDIYKFILQFFYFFLQRFGIAVDIRLEYPGILLLDIDALVAFKSFDVLDQFLGLTLISSVFVTKPVAICFLDGEIFAEIVYLGCVGFHLGFVCDNCFTVAGVLFGKCL